jgi:hypothetical protein
MSWSADDISAWLNDALAFWNLYGLPLLLMLAAIAWFWRRDEADRDDRRVAIRRLGLSHYGLALWGLITIAAEVWEAHASGQGIYPSNPVTGLYGSVIATLLDVPIGFGLRRLWRAARWAALAPAIVRVAFGVWATSWIWTYGATFDPADWPTFTAARLLPVFAMILLLWPGTGRVFRGSEPAVSSRIDMLFALVALLFLSVLGSVVVTDAADRLIRAVVEGWESVPT